MVRRRAWAQRGAAFSLVVALLFPALQVTAAVAVAAALTPVASWNFDEGSGTTIHDGVGNRDGSLGTASWTMTSPHAGNAALSLPTTEAQATIPNGSALEPAGAISVALWVRSTSPNGGILVQKGNGDCGYSWHIVQAGSHVYAEWQQTSSGGGFASGPDRVINDGAWHHVVWTMTPGYLSQVYVDGLAGPIQQTPAGGINYDPTGQTDPSVIIGPMSPCTMPEPPDTFDIDDLQLYDVALGSSDVWELETPFLTTTSLDVAPSTAHTNTYVTLTSHVSPLPPGGTVYWHYSRDGGPDQGLGAPVDAAGVASWSMQFGAGSYVMHAEFTGVGPAAASQSGDVAFTVDRWPTTATLVVDGRQSPLPGASFVLHASVTPQGIGGIYPWTPFALSDVSGSDPVDLGTTGDCTSAVPYGSNCDATMTIPGRPVGIYKFRAHFLGNDNDAASDSAILTVTVAKGTPSLQIWPDQNPIQVHHTAQLMAAVSFPGATQEPADGTLLIRDLVSGSVLASGAPGVTSIQVPVVGSTVGSHGYRAEWSGDDEFAAGSSDVSLQTVADVVEATGIGLSATSFYPVVDGYRDTVSARGTRQEPVSVAITVRNSSGSIVRRASIAARTGAYAWAWNGKNTAGTLLAAGTYRVTQVLKDAAGTTKTVTTSVTLSRKKLYWYTKDLYRTSAQYQKKTSSWGAWLFTMPSATSYRSLRLYVDAKSNGGSGEFGAHDRRVCAFSSINPGCWSHTGGVPFIRGWSSIALNSTYDRDGRYVRAYVRAEFGGISVYNLRLHLQYGILK